MPEFTKTTPRPHPNYIWILLGILTLPAYLLGLTLPLVGPDEPRYAQVAREMFERGDLITPTLGGHTWFEKPPLLYWLEIAAYSIFGVNEFAARIGAALFGLGTVGILWFLASQVEEDGADRPQLAKWTFAIAASTLGILVFAHGASFDIIITLPMTAAMVSFFIFDRTRKVLPLTLFFVFVGVSLLAKGLIGIVLPYGIIAFYFVLARKLPETKFVLSLVWGTVLSLAVACIWYVPVYLINGWPFVDEFFVQHHFQRFVSNKYQHPQPFYFYLWVLPMMMLPWFGFFCAGIVNGIKREIRPQPATSASQLLLFCISWIAVPVAFFSLAGSKLPGYVLPALPPAIVIAALWVARSTTRNAWRTAALAISAITLAGTAILILTVVPQFARMESIKPLLDAAEARNYTVDRIYAVNCSPHGAEFYTPDRILRGADGVQKKLYSGPELKSEMERAGVTRALVIIPAVYPDDLMVPKLFKYEKLAENGELAIYMVELLGSAPQTVH